MTVAQSPNADILGSWQGTSLCVDRQHFPACTDERVIYDVRPRPGSPNTVTLRADKLVNGVREFMNESDFRRAADGSWISDLQTPRFHLRVVLQVAGTRLSGTLTDLASGRRVRAMTLVRTAHPPDADSIGSSRTGVTR
jgi:hypothetical protein